MRINEVSLQEIYQKTILFAAERHAGQTLLCGSGNVPYVVHLSNVTMEVIFAAAQTENFDAALAIQVALLHDVIEDTPTTEAELETAFGAAVTAGVKALTKNENLPKEQRIADALQRILKQPKEIWAVKLADRITNLQPPPASWSVEKIKNYKKDAILIYETLKDGNAYLAQRLLEVIGKYAA